LEGDEGDGLGGGSSFEVLGGVGGLWR
jgi:hypothetical protein